MACLCRERRPIVWLITYQDHDPVTLAPERVTFGVCTPCLNERLDLADRVPSLEPDGLLRIP